MLNQAMQPQYQPQPQAQAQSRGLQELNPTRTVARRGRDLMIIGALLMLAGLVAAGIGVFIALLFGGSSLFVYLFILIGVVIIIVGLGVLIRGMTLRRENDPALLVGQVLRQVLDNHYALIRNVSRPRLGYIDAVLVGPPGVVVYRLVDKPGVYQNEGSDWLEKRDQRFVLSKLDATRECVTDVYALRDYLLRYQLGHVPVYALVVFTDPSAQITGRQPVVPIATLNTMLTALRLDFLTADRIDAASVDGIIKLLYQ